MPVFVSKFGGSSLADGERFLRVLRLVKSHPDRRIVVLSAPGKRKQDDMKITDLLIKCARTQNRADFYPVQKRFSEIADCLGVSIQNELKEAEALVFSGAGEAAAASRGEWLSAKIFSKASGFYFLDAKDAVFFSGENVDEEKTGRRILSAFEKNKSIVLPGFYGADEKNNLHLFPRGGSDTTGAIAAYAVKADLYENWTDVNGIFDKDPNLFGNAQILLSLSYDEAERILLSGACVLSADCISWARKSSTPILVKNTFFPEKSGTRIGF